MSNNYFSNDLYEKIVQIKTKGELYEARNMIADGAVNYLNDTLFANDTKIEYLNISLDTTLKEQDRELYDINLKIFKVLFNSNDETLLTALWNAACFYLSSYEFDKSDFTQQEYDFLIQIHKIKCNEYQCNINAPIETDRLVMRPIEQDDVKLLAHHFEFDGDFTIFTLNEEADDIHNYALMYAIRRAPLFFAIEEKTLKTLLGYVGIAFNEFSNEAKLEYYIFKEHRKFGYCKEAVNALIHCAFNSKLLYPFETLRENCYEIKPVELDQIIAEIATANTPSIKLVESCGFEQYDLKQKTKHFPDLGWVDEAYYRLKNKK